MEESINVLGGKLETCSTDPMTGWFRDGCCNTDERDYGRHVVCAVMTDIFLAFSKGAGNDLSSPGPGFSGLKGFRCCLGIGIFMRFCDVSAWPSLKADGTNFLPFLISVWGLLDGSFLKNS